MGLAITKEEALRLAELAREHIASEEGQKSVDERLANTTKIAQLFRDARNAGLKRQHDPMTL